MQLTYKLVNDVLRFVWHKYPQAHHYRLMAMSQTFVYSSIGVTTGLKYDFHIDKEKSYIRFKVVAESIDNNILCESNEIDSLPLDFERFKISFLKGYNGVTLAFRSKVVYDLYRVYNKDTLVAETEDPVLEFPYQILENKLKDIVVEGYVKIDDRFVLGGVSDGIVQLPERVKSDYKISVVVPVYNSQIFLPRTLDSILSSSMPDLEVILVNDGSTDDSLNICDWYVNNFPCVSVITQSNQGVAVARNNGISVAKGNYLGLVDNDDIVHPLMYEKLYNACEKEDVDIAIATTLIHNDVNSKEVCLGLPGKQDNVLLYTYEQVVKNMNNENNIYFVAVWNKIVKLEVAKQVKFPTDFPNEIVLYEDSAYTPTLYSYIDKFAICRDSYYIWDKRKQKTIGTASTMYKGDSAEKIWKTYIYACLYPFYNGCKKHKELSDYYNFGHLIKDYDKFTVTDTLYEYWNEKLRELIYNQKLMENRLIMEDEHLGDLVKKFIK